MRTDEPNVEDLRQVLKNWLIYDLQKTDDGYLVIAQYALPVWFCPRCEVVNPRLHRYGTKEQTFTLPILGLKVQIIRQRYQCRECSFTFWEPISYQGKFKNSDI